MPVHTMENKIFEWGPKLEATCQPYQSPGQQTLTAPLFHGF